MSFNSHIEWTEATWNPITGCTKVSPGCKNCYAERRALWLQALGQRNYQNGFEFTLHEHALSIPLQWKKPRIIFVNSMSDMFYKEVPLEFIQRIFSVMHQANWHQYQILTKRSEGLLAISPVLAWAPHIWMGVSVENKDYTLRIEELRHTGAHIKFLSLEPLLGPLSQLNLDGIDWVIVGGESGPKARPVQPSWVTGIRDQCLSQKVPFFFKQWGGVNKKRSNRLLEGRTWDEMPVVLPTGAGCD
jgi:protein gp37